MLSQPGGLCFSRAEPRHKQDIVRLLKDMGEVRWVGDSESWRGSSHLGLASEFLLGAGARQFAPTDPPMRLLASDHATSDL